LSEPIARRLAAEGLGTALLLATVVGSGIMAEKLAGGNVAIALLGNTIPTGAILVVLILIFGPISGAHFNPAVSFVFALRGDLRWSDFSTYVTVQVAAGIIGVLLAHAMFDLPLWQVSTKFRAGFSQQLSEFVAAFGLLLTILGCVARAPQAVATAVGLYITAAYWFTASTSFANPAVTVARALSDTFAGIAPTGVPAFIGAQVLGATAAMFVARAIWDPHSHNRQRDGKRRQRFRRRRFDDQDLVA
jgi:glycerol uptake facilitator-like aquaporin